MLGIAENYAFLIYLDALLFKIEINSLVSNLGRRNKEKHHYKSDL